MKILSAEQIREWDAYTITHEPVRSVDLMERAAVSCVQWLKESGMLPGQFAIFCGKGNNGGDGLAMARILSANGSGVIVYILEFGHLGTDDFQVNLERLHQYPEIEIKFIQEAGQFPKIGEGVVVVDALFGSGLNRPLDGVTATLVDHINQAGNVVISIDIPSGLPVDQSGQGSIIKATHTLTFQVNKMAMLMQENASLVGRVHVLDIGLANSFYESLQVDRQLVDNRLIRKLYRPRDQSAHKGTFGHALIVSGSYGKMGAAVLCTKACIRSGAGLTTVHIPECGYQIMQTALPEAMVSIDQNATMITLPPAQLSKFSSLGIGPGIGTNMETATLLEEILGEYKKPMVLDADALNILGLNKSLLKKIPELSILTPHPKEFERIFGQAANDFDRLNIAVQQSKELRVIIILKGHHSTIVTPDGKCYFNSTGNAGLAKGGSGDVLTGVIAALLAQGYQPEDAAILGVYLHGQAADIAAEKHSQEAMTASDAIDSIGDTFLALFHPTGVWDATEGFD